MNTLSIQGAILFFGFGVLAVLASKSDIQIILAVLCFGFGPLLLVLASILAAIKNLVAVEKP